jgi:beta-lactamase class A
MDLPGELASELAGLTCQYAFYCCRRGAEPLLAGNHQVFAAASLIKLPILFAWAYLERAGRANREEICELDLEPQAGGDGLARLLRSRRLPYHDVLLLMTALSDNLCTNLVIQRIGMARLNGLFGSALGLKDTVLNRRMMDLSAGQGGQDNYISARDCIQLFRLRNALTDAERAWIEPMLLAHGKTALWLREFPPDSVVLAGKSGSLDGVLHEWSYTDQFDLFLLAQKVTDYREVYRALGALGQKLLGQPPAL